MKKNRRKFTQCPNCGYNFEDISNYCPNCGQENHDLNVPVKHLLWEFLEGTIHFDTKVWVTLRYLVFKPGLLTEKFNIGQRASYVPPFRLYVFVSLVFFFVLALSTKKQEERAAPAPVEVTLPKVQVRDPLTDSLLYSKEATVVTSDKQAAAVADSAVQAIENPTFKTAITKVVDFSKGGEQAKQKLLKNTSFMMFLLMPFFAYLLYLFYYKQRRNYVEHLMFSIHLHTFFFVLIIIAASLNMLFHKLDLDGFVFALMVAYLYLALKRVYKQSYGATFFKLIPISFLYLLTLFVFMMGTLAISVIMS